LLRHAQLPQLQKKNSLLQYIKIVPEFPRRHDPKLFHFGSTPTIDIEPKVTKIPAGGKIRLPVL